MKETEDQRLRRTFPLTYNELDKGTKQLNGDVSPLNRLLYANDLPQLTEEYDTPRNRELHMSDLENKLALKAVNSKNWLEAQAEYGKQ